MSISVQHHSLDNFSSRISVMFEVRLDGRRKGDETITAGN